jgi:hypothetical protein
MAPMGFNGSLTAFLQFVAMQPTVRRFLAQIADDRGGNSSGCSGNRAWLASAITWT